MPGSHVPNESEIVEEKYSLCVSPRISRHQSASTSERLAIADTKSDSVQLAVIHGPEDEQVVAPVPPSRSSIDAILDRFEDAPHIIPYSANPTEDSLLLKFDPLLEKPDVASRHMCDYKLPDNPLPSNTMNTMEPDYQNSPAMSESQSRQPINVNIFELSSNPSAFSTKIPLTSGLTASPAIFSPWMHHSILDQALGGSDRSPEWHTSFPTREEPESSKSLISPRGPLITRSTEYLASIGATHEPSTLPNSIPVLADTVDMDALTALLEHVNVRDSSVLLTDLPGADMHGTSSSQPNPALHEDVIRTPDTKLRTTTSDTFKVVRKLDRTIDLSLVSRPSFESNTSSPPAVRSPHDVTKPHTPHLESALIDPCPRVKSRLDISSRLSFGNISGMVSQVARSICDRLGNASGLSTFTRTPTQLDVRVGASPITHTSVHISEERETTHPAFQNNEHGTASKIENIPTIHPLPSACTSFAQSGDEDVWESVDSMNDPKPSVTNTFTKSTSTFDQRLDIVSENKENILPKNADVFISNLHHSWIVCTQSESISTDFSNKSTTDRGDQRRTQLTQSIPTSADAESKPQNSSLCDQQSSIAQEWMNLHDEVSQLRSVADNFSKLILMYERTLLDADAYLHRHNTSTATRLKQLAQERDEAVEQVANVHKACDYMVRGLQRARKTIETKQEKQAGLLKLLEKHQKKYPKMVAKTEKIVEHFTTHLGDALAENQRQKEVDLRKLDKLRFDLRQAELREAAVTDQIRQLDKQSTELTRICQQFFS